MKNFILALLIVTLSSCFGKNHPPIDFTCYVTIIQVEADEDGKCLYHATPIASNYVHSLANEGDGWFYDDCDRFRVGDTVFLSRDRNPPPCTPCEEAIKRQKALLDTVKSILRDDKHP